jgi:hypothetical protein
MLVKRTSAEILREAMDKIAANTPITNFHAGAIARALVEAMAPEYEALYDFAIDVYRQGTLRYAKKKYLDAIGELFNYPRRTEQVFNKELNEWEEQLIDDETYRYELSQRVHTIASSNEEAVRLACLTIPGVQNIIGKEFTHGTGSFSLIVVVQNGFDEEAIRSEVEDAVMKTKAYGVRPHIMLPTPVLLDMRIQLLFPEGINDIERDQIRNEVQSQLYTYIGNFGLGQGFIYHDFVQEVMNINKNILDFQVLQFYLNDIPVLLTNHDILEEERIRPNVIEVL